MGINSLADFLKKLIKWFPRKMPIPENWRGHDLDNHWGNLNNLSRLDAAAKSVVAALVGSIFASAILFAIVASVHILTKVRRPRAKVFISYCYNDRNGLAERVETALIQKSIDVVRLDFVREPEHDKLIEDVNNAIDSCDILVCIPGTNESFVAHEVAIAHAQKKPILVLLDSDNSPRVPNTAKKGFPTFSNKHLTRTNYGVIADFCSYLEADRRATLTLYWELLSYGKLGLGLAFKICAVSTIAIASFEVLMHLVFGGSRNHVDWTILVVPYTIMVALGFSISLFHTIFSRIRVRKDLVSAIAGRRFTPEALPDSMPGSIRASIIESLYIGEIKGHHEY